LFTRRGRPPRRAQEPDSDLEELEEETDLSASVDETEEEEEDSKKRLTKTRSLGS
jgi:hypothetical protein